MNTFFSLLKKSIVASVFVMFAVTATYIPQNWNQVNQAHAGGAADKSTLSTQLIQQVELYITALNTTAVRILEFKLDGLAWYLAKYMVSQMVASLVDWINSGFKGRPMFVQDLSGFLRDTADRAIGQYIDELGGPASFLCDPFKLDIQIAIALEYQRARVNQPAPTCTLTDIVGNIEDFTSGALGSFTDNGGWDNWLTITSAPEVYTPYGALGAARVGAQASILNAQGVEQAKLNWGAGFMSSSVCEVVHGAGITKEECFISTPGKIVQEALSFNLDSGRQSLIQADEFNEIIAALFSQLANVAVQGAAGFLGLSSGTGYTYTDADGKSLSEVMVEESQYLPQEDGDTRFSDIVDEDLNSDDNLRQEATDTFVDEKTEEEKAAEQAEQEQYVRETGAEIVEEGTKKALEETEIKVDVNVTSE